MIFVIPNFLVAPICLDPGIEQKEKPPSNVLHPISNNLSSTKQFLSIGAIAYLMTMIPLTGVDLFS